MQKILKITFQSAWFYYLILFIILKFALIPKEAYYQRLNNLKDYSNSQVSYSLGVSKGNHVNVMPMRKAIRYYKLLVKLHPKLARGYAMIGYGYHALGEYRLAARYYLKAVEIQPDYYWFYYNLGVIYFRLKDYEKAVFYFDKVVSQKNTDLFSGLAADPKVFRDKAEIFNKVAFLKSMQIHSDTQNFIESIKKDPAGTLISGDIVLDPMAYLIPIGQENLR